MRGRGKLGLTLLVGVAVLFGSGLVGALWNAGLIDASSYDFSVSMSQVVKNFGAPGSIPTATATATPSPLTLANTAASRFGVAPMGGDANTANAARDAGVTFVRVQLNWFTVEEARTSPPTYNWNLDATLRAFGEKGLKPIVVIWGNPTWAAPNACGPITDLDAFAQFMTAATQRYSQPPYNVHDWELYNEGDQKLSTTIFPGVSCFGNNPTAYVQMLQRAYQAIKAVDSTANVHLGGLAFDYGVPPINDFNLNFLDEVLAAGGGAYFDVNSVHFYSWQQTNWLGDGGLQKYGWDMDTKVNRLREIMAARGVDKPIAISEAGWTTTTCSDPTTPEMQAQYVPKLLSRGVARNLYAMIWFTLNDWSSDIGCEPGGSHTQDYPYGLLTSSLQLRPAYQAFQTANNQFGAATTARPLTPLDLPGQLIGFTGLEGYGFTVAGKQRWVLWNNGTSATTFTLPSGVTAVKDKLGQDVTATSNTISVGTSPVYLQFN